MKIQMHERFSNKQTDTKSARQPRKAVTPKEASHMTAERRDFHVWNATSVIFIPVG